MAKGIPGSTDFSKIRADSNDNGPKGFMGEFSLLVSLMSLVHAPSHQEV